MFGRVIWDELPKCIFENSAKLSSSSGHPSIMDKISDVICLQEVREIYLLILSGYLSETTYNFYTYV